ncbi:MAG: AMP-binding protein, partial [Gammaproteobacteria bacterium]|nr:AMP-binding protein [Gammaproteobacteria bacterium]
SKGAELTHRNLLTNVRQALAMLDAMPDADLRCFLHALPLYHSFSFMLLVGGLSLGANNVLVPSPRPINNLRSAFELFEFDAMGGVNTLFVKLLEQDWFIQNPPSDLRVAIAGGAALHDTVARTWMKVVGVELLQGYGLTETSPVVAVNAPGLHVRRGFVGLPVPGTEIDIVDESGDTVPVGEQGELRVKGPQVMRGYWRQPDGTRQVLKDGWLSTGDIAEMDERGFLRIVDRLKDLILVSGFNVFPNEVESVISKHQDVVDVGVIGVPDQDTGEAVWAFVVPRTRDLNNDAIVAWCRQHLTNYKVPVRVEMVAELPTSTVGKVLRRELKQWVLQGRYD